MSGWKRLGIIFSIIWFIGFFSYGIISNTNQQEKYWESHIKYCYRIYDWNTQKDEEKKCEDLVPYPPVIWKRDDLALMSGIDLATIIIGWLFGWGIISICRWVVRGFLQ